MQLALRHTSLVHTDVHKSRSSAGGGSVSLAPLVTANVFVPGRKIVTIWGLSGVTTMWFVTELCRTAVSGCVTTKRKQHSRSCLLPGLGSSYLPNGVLAPQAEMDLLSPHWQISAATRLTRVSSVPVTVRTGFRTTQHRMDFSAVVCAVRTGDRSGIGRLAEHSSGTDSGGNGVLE